jgi:hypothetical protein
MRTLILSNTTYAWVKYCVGEILKDPNKIQLIVVYKDDDRPLYRMDSLCEDAVYAQRSCDLFKLGKLLGIKKISNLGYYQDDIDLEKFSAQIQLSIMLGGVGKVIYQYTPIFENILKTIRKNSNVELWAYDTSPDSESYDAEINELTMQDKIKKFELRKCMIGINTLSELPDYSEKIEILYKVR